MVTHGIQTEQHGNVLVITFARPEKNNALTLEMANQLFLVLKNATTDRSVRVVLLQGAGGNFMSGLDNIFYEGSMDTVMELSNQLILPYHSIIREIMTMDKPVVSSVCGKVGGAGLSLMLASDLVIGAESTTFSFNSIHFAMSPDGGASFYLTRKVGAGRAAEILLLGEEFDIYSAHHMGVVNRFCPDAELEKQTEELVTRLSQGPTKTYGAIKKLLLHAFDHDAPTHLGMEHAYVGQSARSFDFREAIQSEKMGRKARFTGA